MLPETSKLRRGRMSQTFARRTPLEERFWPKVDCRGPDECWLWTAASLPKGYGRIAEGGEGGRTLLAHRVSYELAVGTIPEGVEIDHICRVPACVNPAHLRIATRAENQQNRAPSGNRGSLSQFRGVHWHPSGRWKAQVKINRKNHHVGYFDDEEEAGAAAARFRAEHMPFTKEGIDSDVV